MQLDDSERKMISGNKNETESTATPSTCLPTDYVMFWNVKTTGFPEKTTEGKFFSPAQFNKYDSSRIVGLSWIIRTPDMESEVSRGSVLIKPSQPLEFSIRPDATRVHGISEKMVHEKG